VSEELVYLMVFNKTIKIHVYSKQLNYLFQIDKFSVQLIEESIFVIFIAFTGQALKVSGFLIVYH